MCLRDLHEKNEHIETVLEFTQNRKNNRERELYKSISSFLVSVFSAPTHPPSIHTLSESVELNRCESVTESNHVGRRTPFRIQGRCWSLQDLSSTSRNHPQKRLHRHQGSSLQGSSFFDSSTPDFFWGCCIVSFNYHGFYDDCGFGHGYVCFYAIWLSRSIASYLTCFFFLPLILMIRIRDLGFANSYDSFWGIILVH